MSDPSNPGWYGPGQQGPAAPYGTPPSAAPPDGGQPTPRKPQQTGRSVLPAQIIAIVVGITVGVLCWLIGVVLVVLLARPEPDDPPGTVVATPRAAGIAFLFGVAAVALGFLRVWLLARSAARSRGERPDGGRPALTWKALISPRGVARLLFVPRDLHGVEDDVVARLGIARTWSAVLVIVVVTGFYDVSDVQVLAAVTYGQAFDGIIAAGTLLAVVSGLVYLRLPADHRAAGAAALRRPIAVTVGAALLLGAVTLWGRRFDGWADRLADDPSPSGGQIMLALLAAVHLVWLIAFVTFSVIYLSRFVFRAAEASPLLAPIVAALATWLLVALSAAEPFVGRPSVLTAETPVHTPSAVRLAVSIGGALTVTALGVFEWRRLTAKGLSLRTGPWR